jgi:hypothetical protein
VSSCRRWWPGSAAVGGGFRVCGRASGCQWRPIGPDIPEHAFPRGRSPHPSADRVRGDRRRSLHSGNSDRRSADRLRGLPAAIISSEGPYWRRFSSYPVPDSGPCSGAKLCDDHFRVVTSRDCDLTPVGRGMPRAPVRFFGCGGTPHGRGSSAE